ncbi:TetR/AcrR family transcriptional regulator [Natranaerofaba carboxydovora]|uniref:TetR/AcrR family transcriptional regulator n=1 Tax=Natranaerofaba carboxydovora TaxID=2742683 RepID=UPI001F136226|nr:TetR/AcrR family transcriptional regulator [Natranaerofaba carboxydovora]UMZ74643.1 Fatty acid metabolism regulator protein [Natranaerofaba carboxydovora]
MILDAARKVFGQKGFHDAKVDEVAKEADIAKGSVYLYFSSKEELFEEMMKEGIREYKELKMAILNKDMPLVDKLKLLLQKETEFLWENQDVARFLFTSDILSTGTLYEWLIDIRGLFIEKLKSEFEKGIKNGKVAFGDSNLYTRIFRGVEQQVICYYIIIDGEKPNEELIEKSMAVLTDGIFLNNNLNEKEES